MRCAFFSAIVAGLAMFAAGCGDGNAKIKEQAAHRHLTAFKSLKVTGQHYGEFRNALANSDREAAVEARDKFKKVIDECNGEFAAYAAHEWKSAQESEAACKKLLKTHETVTLPEMNAILEKWTADGPPDPELVASAAEKINAAVLDEIDAADEAANKLLAETTTP